MKISCTIDGTVYNLNVNADKPLNLIISELLDSFQKKSDCTNASCGNCLILINGNAVLSCLVPAFKVNNLSILTYSGFKKTRSCHDIEKAYLQLGIHPCSQCYASKTLLIGSLLNRFSLSYQNRAFGVNDIKNEETSISNPKYLEKELSLINCNCTDIDNLIKIIELAYQNRRKRSGR